MWSHRTRGAKTRTVDIGYSAPDAPEPRKVFNMHPGILQQFNVARMS